MSAWVQLCILLSVPVTPLLLVAGITLPGFRQAALRLAPLAAAPGLALALLPGSGSPQDIPWLLLGSTLGLDDTGRIFLLLTALLWLAAGLYAQGYCAKVPLHRNFWIFFLLTMSGNLGLTLALDMVSFYCCFTLMSFAAYGLIIHDRTTFALRAGKIYLVLVIGGEVLLFTALVLAAQAADSLLLKNAAAVLATTTQQPLILTLLLIAFGIKMGVPPLHFWLPLAHPAAPIPASAVLSGVMIKAGLLGLLRLFPLGFVALPGWSIGLISMGLLMAFFGVIIGLFQSRPKTLLAYSSISQLGFPLLGIGLGLGQPENWHLLAPAVSFYCLHHGLAKGALFLGVGMAPGLHLSPLVKVGTSAGLLLPALALAGAPWTSGAAAKGGLKHFLQPTSVFDEQALSLLVALAAVGTTLLMCRFLILIQQKSSDSASISWPMSLGWLLPLAALVFYGTGPSSLTGIESVATSALSDTLLPLLTGILLAVLIRTKTRHIKLRWEPPPGDLFTVMTSAAHRLTHHLPAARINLPALPSSVRNLRWQNLPILLLLRDTEKILRRLSVAGVMFMILLLLLLLI